MVSRNVKLDVAIVMIVSARFVLILSILKLSMDNVSVKIPGKNQIPMVFVQYAFNQDVLLVYRLT